MLQKLAQMRFRKMLNPFVSILESAPAFVSDTLREKRGLKEVVPYTLWHRAAMNSILRTDDLKMTSLMLGHNSTRTTERYTHVAQEHLINFAKKATG